MLNNVDCGNIKYVDNFCSEFKGAPDYEDYISDDEDDNRNPIFRKLAT